MSKCCMSYFLFFLRTTALAALCLNTSLDSRGVIYGLLRIISYVRTTILRITVGSYGSTSTPNDTYSRLGANSMLV